MAIGPVQLLVLGFKQPDVQVLHQRQLSGDDQAAFGALVGGLIGLGAAGQAGFEVGASPGAPPAATDHTSASGGT
jgi:hypothetical protein